MTKIKLCGLSRMEDVYAANACMPEYIGFVFWDKSKRNVTREKALALKKELEPSIQSVGVFVDERIDVVASYYRDGMIDVVQLHGSEDAAYMEALRKEIDAPLIKAFRIRSEDDVMMANNSTADYVMLDAGKGEGIAFDWRLIQKINRPYFLAGGLSLSNVAEAVKQLHPYAVDVSSGIETDGKKDKEKMINFVQATRACRKEEK